MTDTDKAAEAVLASKATNNTFSFPVSDWAESEDSEGRPVKTCGSYAKPMEHLQRMARLWLMRKEIIEALCAGGNWAANEGADDEAKMCWEAVTKIEELDENGNIMSGATT